jgi:hypothetical protein
MITKEFVVGDPLSVAIGRNETADAFMGCRPFCVSTLDSLMLWDVELWRSRLQPGAGSEQVTGNQCLAPIDLMTSLIDIDRIRRIGCHLDVGNPLIGRCQ